MRRTRPPPPLHDFPSALPELAAGPGALQARVAACLHACRHAWKRRWQRSRHAWQRRFRRAQRASRRAGTRGSVGGSAPGTRLSVGFQGLQAPSRAVSSVSTHAKRRASGASARVNRARERPGGRDPGRARPRGEDPGLALARPGGRDPGRARAALSRAVKGSDLSRSLNCSRGGSGGEASVSAGNLSPRGGRHPGRTPWGVRRGALGGSRRIHPTPTPGKNAPKRKQRTAATAAGAAVAAAAAAAAVAPDLEIRSTKNSCNFHNASNTDVLSFGEF